MTAPAWNEYAWINDADVGVELSVCCLSLITDAVTDKVVDALPAARDRFEASHDELDERMMEQRGHVLGLVQSGSGVVMFEPNGYIGNSFEVMGPVSAGRVIASYYSGGHGVTGFNWYADRHLRAHFEPAQSICRDDPDYLPPDLIDQMVEVGGFRLYSGDPYAQPELDSNERHHIEASLALCEVLTGIRGTKELLRDSAYLCFELGPI